MKEIKTISDIIDGSVEDLKEHIADKDLGYVRSIDNQLVYNYYNLMKVKDALKSAYETNTCVIEGKTIDEAKEECRKTLEGVYAKMLKIEQLLLFLKEEKESRKLS